VQDFVGGGYIGLETRNACIRILDISVGDLDHRYFGVEVLWNQGLLPWLWLPGP